MTATSVPVRPRPPRAARLHPGTAGRLLRLELRRNGIILVLPLLAALVAIDFFRANLSGAAATMWGLSSSQLANHLLRDFAMFGAGAAAWAGSREGRRHVADLLTATPRPGWARLGATLAATMGWLLAALLACVAIQFAVTAGHATWGGPPLWPVAATAAGTAAACGIGFALGVYFPSRFTAPLAALAGLFPSLAIRTSSVYANLWPTTRQPPEDVATFFHYLPDTAILQVLFLGGLTVAAVGVLGLPAAAGGRRLREAAAAVTLAGLAAAGTAAGLAGTAQAAANGTVIPALHDAASDRPVAYSPVCQTSAGTRVCVQPAFRQWLGNVSAALAPALREVAGLPGAPALAGQIATDLVSAGGGLAVTGTPPVFRFPLLPPSTADPGYSGFAPSMQDNFVATFIGGLAGAAQAVTGSGFGGTPAQQAVEAVLLGKINPASLQSTGPANSFSDVWLARIRGAVTRFGALPAATRHAWLATHLPALRAGRITLAQLP